jgi:type 1 glutamine amidotransferase
MTVLATAYADPATGGSGEHEPMIMTIDYGKGRVFHTPMGHSADAMRCVAFGTVLLRGCEWAATGDVTLTEVPQDFPSADAVSTRQ